MGYFKNLLAVLILALACDAEARTLTVDPAGTDTGDCSSPCATVNYAITQTVMPLAAGDTITINNGNYATQSASSAACSSLGTYSYNILINAKPCAGCTITATNALGDVTLNSSSGAAICLRDSNGWTIQKLSFTGQNAALGMQNSDGTLIDVTVNYDQSSSANAFYVRDSTITWTRVTLTNTLGCPTGTDWQAFGDFENSTVTLQQSAFSYDGSLFGIKGGSNHVIKRNRFKMWTEHGITLTQNPVNVVIENNIFESDPACTSSPLTGPRVFDFYEGTDIVARNNTIVGHGRNIVNPSLYATYTDAAQAAAGCTGSICNRQNWKFYNNLYYDADIDNSSSAAWFKVAQSATTTQAQMGSDYNLYNKSGAAGDWWTAASNCGIRVSWSVWQGCDVWGGTNNMDSNSILTAPTFVNYAGLDYRAPSVSAAQVDAGSSATATDAEGVAPCATEDFLGNPRGGDNGACDIGAYEFQQTGGGGGDPDPGQSTPRVYQHLGKIEAVNLPVGG